MNLHLGTRDVAALHRRPASVGPALAAEADETNPVVLIVDDDPDVRIALEELLMSVGIAADGYASAADLIAAGLPDRPCCIILDVRLPGASGLDVQDELEKRGDAPPVVFLTGHGDIPMTVKAMKAGAVDFLTKPVREQSLLDAVAAALARDTERRERARIVAGHLARFADLTPRERQVIREVAAGRLNKQIAYDLGISEVTVKLHRGNATRKLNVTSVSQLIRLWETLPENVRTPAET